MFVLSCLDGNPKSGMAISLGWFGLGGAAVDQSFLLPYNQLLNEDTESAEVMDCASLFHSGVVLSEKWFFNSVVLLRVMNNLSWVAGPLVAL